ncbi:class I SAM-dependent methyltransferase [Ensifer aridi]|uniref:class I SAM-dependent methyltransferase n=1 Tax=Ensifer aridi TaxID=1708715 RepID=UPI000A11028C|nr:class I SAM-dependent methyltransferase [Ensifer aridi]
MSDDFTFGESWSSIYREFTGIRGKIAEADETVAFLESYVSNGSALELGIGDGRVAVPLSERGVKVDGIDNSDSMLKLLAERTNMVNAWKGDIANFSSEQRYGVIYCVYNTFRYLLTRESQIACLRSASAALADDGALVMEMNIPALDGFISRQKTSTLCLDSENTILSADIHDPLNQTLTTTVLWFSGTSVKSLPHRARYVYHQELDTMAECAGLELAERWADWARGEFNESSRRHVSVYRRAGQSRSSFKKPTSVA